MLTARSRGQTLPVWAFGIATALIVALGALQYGTVLRWQIRAQNAADAAAAGALSVQTSAWNQQMAALYAAAVEEYRLRNLLAALIVASSNDPSCGGASNCGANFARLREAYLESLARYRADVQLVNRISQYTLADAESDARAIVGGLASGCGAAAGGDCGFDYTVVAIGPRAGTLNTVMQGANAWAVNYPGLSAWPKDDYTPAQIEVVACATVTPPVPAVLGFRPPTFTAIGRAAATSAMVTQEWLDPGRIVDPATNAPFQPIETAYEQSPVSPGPAGHDWYSVDFGGNPTTAHVGSDSYSENAPGQEFTAVTGWWSTIPIKPFSGPLDVADIACKSS